MARPEKNDPAEADRMIREAARDSEEEDEDSDSDDDGAAPCYDGGFDDARDYCHRKEILSILQKL